MKIETELSDETLRFISACMAFGVLFASDNISATSTMMLIKNYYEEASKHASLTNLMVELDNKITEVER